MRTVPQQNGHLIYFFKSRPKDHSMSSRFRIHFYLFHSASAAVVGSFLCRTLCSFPFLHHVNVLLSALSHTMSVLSAVETLFLRAFAVAFHSMKIALIIAKCLS